METQLKTTSPIYRDDTLISGMVFFIISCIMFGVSAMIDTQKNSFDFFTGSFFICYLLFFCYFIMLLNANKAVTGRYFRFSNLKYNILLLLLGNLSAYALNREIPVFQESTNWLIGYLVLLNLALIGYVFRSSLRPNWINYVIAAIVSSGVLFGFYEVIYIMPYYAITGVSFWFFGISLHTLIPLWIFITTIKVTKKYWKNSVYNRYAIIIGWSIPILFLLVFVTQWYSINKEISSIYHDTTSPFSDGDLPMWVEASKNIPDGMITEKVLKSELVYTIADVENFEMFPSSGGRFNERKKHDPLIVVASLFSGRLKLNFNEKIKLLETMYNTRHQTERRLWRGDNLYTKDIITNVQLFPEYRLAYTEKMITIKNKINRSWRNRQEAIYSFYLPEGAVVTSASLWVNGKEEKSYLTTRGKADTAYTAIVGVERRDPLLLHWQEGNRISVRVFPCTPKEDRQFKIGVTTPLKQEGTELVYENIDFKGPNFDRAEESVHIISEGVSEEFNTSLSLRKRKGEWHYQGQYQSNWKLRFAAPPISNEAFSFNGRNFTMEVYQPDLESFKAKEVYLDLHRGWSGGEVRRVWNILKDQEVDVFVYTNKMERLTTENYTRLIGEARYANYSLFPFQKIKTPEAAIVITNNSKLTPNLNDLKKTKFATELKTFLSDQTNPIRLFNIGEELSPYLKTLKEIRAFIYTQDDLTQLKNYLNDNTFVTSGEDEQSIVIDYANIKITEKEGALKNTTATDHLMRLFAYNDLMKKMGKGYFNKEELSYALIDQAKEAYVVTPISSLIVLETQKDYDRFDIKKSKNSLQNADFKSTGAVPEPHEWLLILLGGLLGFYLVYRTRFGGV